MLHTRETSQRGGLSQALPVSRRLGWRRYSPSRPRAHVLPCPMLLCLALTPRWLPRWSECSIAHTSRPSVHNSPELSALALASACLARSVAHCPAHPRSSECLRDCARALTRSRVACVPRRFPPQHSCQADGCSDGRVSDARWRHGVHMCPRCEAVAHGRTSAPLPPSPPPSPPPPSQPAPQVALPALAAAGPLQSHHSSSVSSDRGGSRAERCAH